MPTYEYECDACGHQMELFQRISEDPIKKCPSCKKSKLRRLFGTGAAIVFKGSGFYETDYRSDSYKKGAEKANESGGEGKAAEKSDAKSASAESTSSSSSDSKAAESKTTGSKPGKKTDSSSNNKKKN